MPATSVLPRWLAKAIDSLAAGDVDGDRRRIADGVPVDLSYVWFITVRDGRVTHFRDYMNPRQLSMR